MGELNIDASLVKGSALVQTEERLVELTNGCICCTLRGDLVAEVGRLAAEGAYDYCIIESTGIGEPMQVRRGHTHTVAPQRHACVAAPRGCEAVRLLPPWSGGRTVRQVGNCACLPAKTQLPTCNPTGGGDVHDAS